MLVVYLGVSVILGEVKIITVIIAKIGQRKRDEKFSGSANMKNDDEYLQALTRRESNF